MIVSSSRTAAAACPSLWALPCPAVVQCAFRAVAPLARFRTARSRASPVAAHSVGLANQRGAFAQSLLLLPCVRLGRLPCSSETALPGVVRRWRIARRLVRVTRAPQRLQRLQDCFVRPSRPCPSPTIASPRLPSAPRTRPARAWGSAAAVCRVSRRTARRSPASAQSADGRVSGMGDRRSPYDSLSGQARRRTLPSSTAMSSRTREQLLAERIWGSCLARLRRSLSIGGAESAMPAFWCAAR